MNKRQRKKMFYKSFLFGNSYTISKKEARKSHEASYRLNRKEFWILGENSKPYVYPNRARIHTYFRSL